MIYDSQVSGLKGAAEVHLGGDEVKPGCWEKTPAIVKVRLKISDVNSLSYISAVHPEVKWMNSTPAIGGNYTKAYNYFVNKAGDLARAKGLSVINWVEAWEQGKGGALDKSVVVHVWKSRSELAEVRMLLLLPVLPAVVLVLLLMLVLVVLLHLLLLQVLLALTIVLAQVLESGYRAIISDASQWYDKDPCRGCCKKSLLFTLMYATGT